MKYYSASLDKFSKGTAIFIFILFSGISANQIYTLQTKATGAFWSMIVLIGLLVAILLMSYLYRTSGYQVSSNALTIIRPIGNKEISLQAIRKVETPLKESMRWTIRTFGNGGLFGYWGKFSNTTYGNIPGMPRKDQTTSYLIQKRKV